MRCDDCKRRFGFLEDGNKLPTKNIFEVPQIYCNKCYEQWAEEHKKLLRDLENHIHEKNIKPICEMPKTKLLGTILILFAIYFTAMHFSMGRGVISEYLFCKIILSYNFGIALLVLKKKSLVHTLMVICGIIVLALHIFFIIIAAIIIIVV